MTPDEYCERRAAGSGSSFYYSFLFLPHDQRRAITALYAFCREVDDVVDETSDAGVARMKLAWWRTEIAAVFSGQPQHPVGRALVPAVRHYPLTESHFQEILDGMEMDLGQNRYPDFAALELYCHRVAGVVGLMAAEIFGRQEQATLEYAHTLGIAFQLTNIVRDVGEDARRGRIYLPAEDMKKFSVAEADILALRETPAFRALVAFQIERARAHYERAMTLLPQRDRRNQRAGLVMAAIYRTLLAEIESDGCRVLSRRVSLTPIRKLWIAWRTWVKG
jgi:phytoene synthase